MSYFSKHREGLWGTIIVHGILLVILLLFGFFTPLPLPGEEGILVNFGDSEQGFGEVEPAPSRQQTSTPPAQQEQEEVVQQATPPPPASSTPEIPSAAEEEVMTQDMEETAAIESARKEAEEEAQRQAELEAQRVREEQARIEAERQAELDAQRQREEEERLEAERQRQEELERQRLLEEERLRQEAEQQQIAEINSRAANAFGSGGAGDTNSTSTSQGVTYPGGNQGNPNGAAGASDYGDGGSGSGNSGNGPSFSLSGRNALSLPLPNYPGREEGIVVVAVTVDKYGNVTSAEPGARGSSTYNASLLEAAKQAASKAKFNADEAASAFQSGTITYRFVLD